MNHTAQRVVGVLVLLVAGMVSLPVAAYFLDDEERTETVEFYTAADRDAPHVRAPENWVVPAQLLVMAAVGAGVTVALPALAQVGASRERRALVGAVWGILAAVGALAVFWVLLSGLGGA